MPEAIKERAFSDQDSSAGPLLLAWWRRQDPLPASPANERMLEHIRRVIYAEEHFACAACPAAYDARGDVFVRFGEPERITRILFDDPLLIDEIYQPGLVISPGDFPDNTFWRYLNVDRDAYFLFVEDQGQYRHAETLDLLPSTLRTGLQSSGRGLIKSQMALAVLRSVYRQLALEHPHFGARFNDVDLWISARESTGRLRSRDLTDNIRIITGANLMSGAERPDEVDESVYNRRAAYEFVQTMLSNARMEDQQVAYQQEILLPVTFSQVRRTIDNFPLAVRHARFLNSDGTTRTEVYWSPEPGGLHPAGVSGEDEYLIHLFVRQLYSDYTLREDTSKIMRVHGVGDMTVPAMPAQSITLTGDSSPYHLALQWDQYGFNADGERHRLQVATEWIDSLHALDFSGVALEMSDLKPVVGSVAGPSRPYPFVDVVHELVLGIYFEVYHLTYNADDETQYTITYEIKPRSGRKTTSVTSSHQGRSRKTQEEIILDFSGWTGPVRVTVTVEDDVTGAQVSRGLDFNLIR